MKSLSIAILVLVAGCAPTWEWRHPTKNLTDFKKDSYECERDVRQSGYYGGGIAGALNAQEFGARCMESKGYYKAPRGKSSIESPTMVDCRLPQGTVMYVSVSECAEFKGRVDDGSNYKN